ncbi:hypothetical protein F8388_012229, partial [Cannabis sativa]
MRTSGVTKFEGQNANEPGLQHLFILNPPNQMWGKDETSGRGLDSKVGWTLYWRKEWFSHSGKKEIAFLTAYGPMATYFSRGCKKGGFRTEKWNRGGISQRWEKHLAPSDPIRSSSAIFLLPYRTFGLDQLSDLNEERQGMRRQRDNFLDKALRRPSNPRPIWSRSSTRPENGRAALHVDVGYALHPMTQFTNLGRSKFSPDGALIARHIPSVSIAHRRFRSPIELRNRASFALLTAEDKYWVGRRAHLLDLVGTGGNARNGVKPSRALIKREIKQAIVAKFTCPMPKIRRASFATLGLREKSTCLLEKSHALALPLEKEVVLWKPPKLPIVPFLTGPLVTSFTACLDVKLADLIGCDIDLTGGTKSKNISTCRDPLCSCLARASTSFPIALRLCLDLLHAKSEVCKPMEIPLGLIPRLMTKGESAWRKVKIEGSRAKFPSGVFRRSEGIQYPTTDSSRNCVIGAEPGMAVSGHPPLFTGGHRGFVVVTGRSELHFSKAGGQRVTKSDPLSSGLLIQAKRSDGSIANKDKHGKQQTPNKQLQELKPKALVTRILIARVKQ